MFDENLWYLNENISIRQFPLNNFICPTNLNTLYLHQRLLKIFKLFCIYIILNSRKSIIGNDTTSITIVITETNLKEENYSNLNNR